MAEKKAQGVEAGVMNADDGWSYVRALEDNSLNEYLSLYNARLEGYRIEPKEYGTKITMKISFPLATSASNVNLWTFFIAQATHKIGKKPFIQVHPQSEGYAGYCTFTVFRNPKYIESKGSNSADF